MQELRLVLIVVGGLAILALLVHGLWAGKKESKQKFGAKQASADALEQDSRYAEDDFDVVKKSKGEPSFGITRSFEDDPLEADSVYSDEPQLNEEEVIPSIQNEQAFQEEEKEVIFSDGDVEMISRKRKVGESEPEIPESQAFTEQPETPEAESEQTGVETAAVAEEPEEEPFEVLVLNVHTADKEPFVGTSLFESMEQNGLKYGEMDIYHRHSDLSGTGKVLFSVANMMRPGTLKHDDPATFTTKGISFFMTLPCFGDESQNFKLMLKAAQQIADDLNGHLLDEQRNMVTPDKLNEYRQKIREFKAKTSA